MSVAPQVNQKITPTADQPIQYELVRRIAAGGMAELYLAHRLGPGPNKPVVLKTILPHLAEDRLFIEMFMAEAKTAAMLRHPNIVEVFDFGERQGDHFIAMDYINGPDIRTLLRVANERKILFPLAACARIAADVADALSYAHTFVHPGTNQPMGMIHRDISPDNILISRDGIVKLVDFGIAKAEGLTSLTRTGALKGKCSYMSPEQLRGDPLDPRVDVFALGMVLYELVVGEKPYKTTSEANAIQKILYEPMPPITRRRQGVPEELERIVERATAKHRDDRYASAAEFRDQLNHFVELLGPFTKNELAMMVDETMGPDLGVAINAPPTPRSMNRSMRRLGFDIDTSDITHLDRVVALPPPTPKRKIAWSLWLPLLSLVTLIGFLSYTEFGPGSRPQQTEVAAVAAAAPIDQPIGRPTHIEASPAPAPAPPVAQVAAPQQAPENSEPPSTEKRRSPSPHRRGIQNSSRQKSIEPAASKAVISPTIAAPVEAKPSPPPPPPPVIEEKPMGQVLFRIRPYATIYIDGRLLGQTPLPTLNLSQGTHQARLRNIELGQDVTFEIQVKGGELSVIKRDLEAMSAPGDSRR